MQSTDNHYRQIERDWAGVDSVSGNRTIWVQAGETVIVPFVFTSWQVQRRLSPKESLHVTWAGGDDIFATRDRCISVPFLRQIWMISFPLGFFRKC
jgi:hypothetical protein